uniref:Uncharacterized protein n=1 Tax=Leersia perrieri TaxID=77586 RepID=A0A0D9XRV0_9ORYZ
MSGSFVVTKSPEMVVQTSKPATNGAAVADKKIELSPFDRSLVRTQTKVLLVFEHPINEPMETIRRSLSRALVDYYPLAGRLAVDGNDYYIDCSIHDGVTFATASLPAGGLDGDATGARHDQSAAKAGGCNRANFPLLTVQVTVFACGGFVVGVVWDHSVADGFGMAQFLLAVGELARGLPTPSIVPLRNLSPMQLVMPPVTYAVMRFIGGMPSCDLGAGMVNVTAPSTFINRIKSSGTTPAAAAFTVFEIVTAVVWKCRTRGVMADPAAPAVLLFSVNVRKQLGVDDAYYGNCMTLEMAMADSGEVASADILDVAWMIRRAKEQISDQDSSGELLKAIGELGERRVGYESVVFVTCWREIGFEDVDFGGGKTGRVMTFSQNFAMPLCVICLPCKWDKGSKVLSGCVTAQHSDAFLREISTLTNNLTD